MVAFIKVLNFDIDSVNCIIMRLISVFMNAVPLVVLIIYVVIVNVIISNDNLLVEVYFLIFQMVYVV